MPQPTLQKELPQSLLQAEGLPSLPTVAVEVLQLTQDEDATLDELAQTLSRDPALAAKLLKLSNSSLFNPGYAITTLQRATMVLGMKTVKLMSLSFSLASSVPTSGSSAGFELKEYWKRSMINAVASRALGERLEESQGDEAFLCGLLGHLGRMVLGECLPGDDYGELVRECGGWPSEAEEEARLGFSSVDVVSALLQAWELPADIYLPILYRSQLESIPAETPEYTRELANVLEVSHLVEEVLCAEHPGEWLAKLGDKAQRHFGITQDLLDEFLIHLEPAVKETADMLNVDLPKTSSYQEIIDQARLQIVNVSMGLNVELRQANRRSEELEGRNRELKTEANTDKLTGLPNRKHFDEFLCKQIADRVRASVPRALGLVMIDVDRFKSFNDTHGHAAGDEVLRMVGSVLANATRKGDLPARFGGEEFSVILPQTTPFALRAAAERLRKAIENASLVYAGEKLSVTASFGGACIIEIDSEADGKKLTKLADHYLYKAKENGRNRSEIAPRIVRLPKS